MFTAVWLLFSHQIPILILGSQKGITLKPSKKLGFFFAKLGVDFHNLYLLHCLGWFRRYLEQGRIDFARQYFLTYLEIYSVIVRDSGYYVDKPQVPHPGRLLWFLENASLHKWFFTVGHSNYNSKTFFALPRSVLFICIFLNMYCTVNA